MTKITIKPDCGNAPKKTFIRDFNVAFAEGNAAFILDHVDENIRWCIYGDFDVSGKQSFKKGIDKMLAYPSPKELIIDSIVTHGSEAAANGLMVMEDTTFAFCDIYKFRSAGSRVLLDLKSFVVKV
ncbi:nuclear transport factor 2 family protein [Fulvivirga sp. 29W222]|uniref:Nuclear transport factor 2 family protein n=1 Tax=Fulvivirga marina TaxID=2494733 RepID=A0A937FZR9_9BACT|nr:nuclear transport factor 2 family protein [Fulvivirga marina]MBL6447943.1 nuclear transport factor 2 family protein [Fulvivirga marina]